MLPAPINAAIRTLAEATPGVELVIVFGSFARGQESEQSDLDVAVLGETDSLEFGAKLAIATGLEVDVVELDQAPIPLLDAVLGHGLTIFERTRGTDARFRSRALTTLETDRRWYERMQNAWLRKVAAGGVLGRP